MNEASTGFNAIGKPIPYARKQAAYEAAKSMGIEDCFSLINGLSEQLERDKPFEAMQVAARYVDLTGAYRILAHLLTPAKERS